MIKTYCRMLQASGTYAPQLQRTLVISLFASIAEATFYALFFPLLILLFTRPFNSTGFWIVIVVMFVLMLSEALLRWLDQGFMTRTSGFIGHELRVTLGEQLRRMPLEILNRRRAGELNMLLGRNVMDVTFAMSNIASATLQALVVPTVVILVTSFFDWRLAIALLIAVPLAVPLYQYMRTLSLRGYARLNVVDAEASSRTVEYIQGLPVLRATGQIDAHSSRWRAALGEQRSVQIQQYSLMTLPTMLMATVVQVAIIGVLALGTYLILQGSLALPVLAALLVIAVRFNEQISVLAALSSVFDMMESGLKRVDELLAIKPLPVAPTPSRIPRSDITFDQVSFTYAGQKEPALRNVSFYLPERSLTALVGQSGSGKTTITRLLSRFADVQQGCVCIGGVDIRDVAPAELMRHISVVFQDVYLFDDTIRNNIRMAKPDATDEEIEAAAHLANCHEFITRLPQGYETGIGEIGGTLSGGERQRISIARALLKGAPIVLLDEPMSALDSESELAVQTAIDRLIANRTVIVIAHRLSTIVAAHTILVLDEGSIVERGTHHELLASQGRYHALWEAQQASQSWRVKHVT